MYKVLTRKGEHLLSLNWNSPFVVEYKEGEKNYGRNGSGLFVFDSLSSANNVAYSKENEIWQVECENPRSVSNVMNLILLWQITIDYEVSAESIANYLGMIDKYWKQRDKFPHNLLVPSIPGTTVCDSLTLIKKVR